MNRFDRQTTQEITKAALFGQAIGDAFGISVEFLSREEVRAINPKDMLGCDTPRTFSSRWGNLIPAGAWSDDTSMTVAAMTSIAENAGSIDCADIMECFIDWWAHGKYTSLDAPFGLGSTVSKALQNFLNGTRATKCGPSGIRDNGNGALMRILPFALYCVFKQLDDDSTVRIINETSGCTHGHAISKMGCVIFTIFTKYLTVLDEVDTAWEKTRTFDYGKYYDSDTTDAYSVLLAPDFAQQPDSIIGETGYVVDTLMTAVYSMLHGHDYESTVLEAISMGYDTDTNAAVAGALAGAFYGYYAIPYRWLCKLRKMDLLEEVATNFARAVYNAG